MSTNLGNYNSTVVQQQLAAAMGNLTAPDYCNMTGPVHWDFGPQTVWQYPQCVGYLDMDEFTAVSPDEVWIYTNFWQRTYARTCQTPPTTQNVSLVDPIDTTNNLIVLGQNCSIDTTYYLNAFVYQPEQISFSIMPIWGTSWKSTGGFDMLQLMAADGTPYGGTQYTFYGSSKVPNAGAQMTLALSDLLAASGVNLDAQNLNSGGIGLDDGYNMGTDTNSASTWPSYRNTGVVLRAKLRMADFRATSPINFNVTGQLFIENASPGAWVSPPSQINYWGNADETYDCASPSRAIACLLARLLLATRSMLTRAAPPQPSSWSGRTRACASRGRRRGSWATLTG